MAAPPDSSTIPAIAATAPIRGLYGREAEISQLRQALDRAAASPPGRALYQATFTSMLAVMNEREGHGSPPDVAAATIIRALTASRPRTMYLTGKDSRRLALLSLLPTPVLDAAKRLVFGLPAAPGSLTVRPVA